MSTFYSSMRGSEVVIFAFDIETRGKSAARNGIVSCGICVGTPDVKVLVKKRWNVGKAHGQGFETRCMDEFWNKNPGLLDELSKDQMSPVEFAALFRNTLDAFDGKFAQVYLVSDNPTFDAGFINYYLDHALLDSMQYKADGRTYRSVHDSDSYARGYMKYGFDRPWVSDKDLGVPLPDIPAHYPENDAERIYRAHVGLVNLK
jgi:hypothetical protein